MTEQEMAVSMDEPVPCPAGDTAEPREELPYTNTVFIPMPDTSAIDRRPRRSYFDGTTLQLIGWTLLGFLLSLVTLGIGFPWVQCMIYRWEAKHTVVQGKRLRFTGTGLQLLGKLLLWGLLSVVTLGIFALFIPVKQRKWHTSHLVFADSDAVEDSSASNGGKVALWILGVVLALAVLGTAGFLLFRLFVRREEIPTMRTDDNYYEVGISYAEQGDYSDALHAFFCAVDQDSSNINVHLAISDVYLAQNDSDAAIAYLEEAISRYPDTAAGLQKRLEELRQPSTTEQTIPEETTHPIAEGEVFYVQANGGLKLRSEPSTSGEVFVIMPKGTEVLVTAWENGWAAVCYDGFCGWCSGDYLGILPPSDEPEENNSPRDSYTWAEVQKAISDSNAYIASYKGKNPGQGRTSMTEEQVAQYYEELLQGGPLYDWLGTLNISDPPDNGYRIGWSYEQVGISLQELCEYYFSTRSDTAAYACLANEYMQIDGKTYSLILGIGDQGLYTEYDLEVKTVGNSFELTMYVRNYQGENNEYVETWQVTHRCFLEDGVWVFDGVTYPWV